MLGHDHTPACATQQMFTEFVKMTQSEDEGRRLDHVIIALDVLEADGMMDLSTQSKRHLGDHGGSRIQLGLGQGREGLGSRVTGWDKDHTGMTIQVT